MIRISQGLPDTYEMAIAGKSYGLRSFDYPDDLPLFHRWMNTEHVIKQWQMNKPLAELAAHCERMLADDHQRLYLILLGETPVGYIEIYECSRDRLARYYESLRYDIGWHLLFGETWFEGHGHLRSVLTMVNHFIFESLPETQRIIFEPDSSVVAFRRIAADLSYRDIKPLAFPEKNATLYLCQRESYFAQKSKQSDSQFAVL